MLTENKKIKSINTNIHLKAEINFRLYQPMYWVFYYIGNSLLKFSFDEEFFSINFRKKREI